MQYKTVLYAKFKTDKNHPDRPGAHFLNQYCIITNRKFVAE